MHAPPPPSHQKKSPLGPILLIFGLGFLVLVIICGLGAFFGFRMVSKPPPTREGFGKPEVVAYTSNGWAKYRLREIPMTLELPDLPKKEIIEWDAGSVLLTKEWIYYVMSTDTADFDLVGVWSRSDESVDMKDEVSYATEWVEKTYNAKNLSYTSKKSKVGQTEGEEFSGDYYNQGLPQGVIGFIWTKDNAVFNFIATFHPESRAQVEAEFRKVVKSIELR